MNPSPLAKLATLLFVALLTLANAQDIGWYNSGSSPYSISTEEELKGLRLLVANDIQDFSGKTINLANDIALTGAWTPIGDASRPFRGIFDGQGYTISGLSVSGATYAGFFGYVGTDGQIKNLNIIGTTISGSSYTGGLAGYYASTKSIENCSVQASISGSFGGGLVGFTNNALTITNSYASGNVICKSVCGGLVGDAKAALTITNSYANGNVNVERPSTGNVYAGGLVGDAEATLTITNSYANGNVNVERTSTGNVYAGGLVGDARAALTITNSYANEDIAVRASDEVACGGLVGYTRGSTTITNSYASVGITGYGLRFSSGGIFGAEFGGFSGTNTSVYYDSDVGGSASGNSSPTGILGMTPANLKKQATFANWDFNTIWGIIQDVSYPYLKINPAKITVPLSNTIDAEYLVAQPYTGTQIKPEPTIKLKADGSVLAKGTDYTLQYGTNKNVGTGTIKVIGIQGDYLGLEETISFDITPKTVTITNAAAQNKTYDGTTTATITGTLEGVIAGDNVSITGTFASKNAGTGIAVSNITLTGAAGGNYKLTQPTGLTANITKKDLTVTLDPKTVNVNASDPMTVANMKVVYNGLVSGESTTGSAVIFKDGVPLNTAPATAGTYSITLGGLNATNNSNYNIIYDTGLQLIVAGALDISTCTVASIPAQTYTGSQITPTNVSLTCTGTYSASKSYGANINVGTGTITWTCTSGCTGTKTASFNITPKTIATDAIQAISNQTYTGAAITPAITVKDGSKILTNGTDYSLAFTSNTEIGTASVSATGKGNYTGTTTANFQIIAATSGSSTASSSSNLMQSSSSSSVQSSSSVVPSSSSTRCKDSQNRELYCNYTSGCYAIDPALTEPAGQTCTALVEECKKYGVLFTDALEEGPGITCTSPSSSSEGSTPIRRPQTANNGNIRIHTTTNAILLSNLPQGIKVEIYNLKGKRVYSAYPENPSILKIGVQTGVYVVKAGSQTIKVTVR